MILKEEILNIYIFFKTQVGLVVKNVSLGHFGWEPNLEPHKCSGLLYQLSCGGHWQEPGIKFTIYKVVMPIKWPLYEQE